MMTRLFKGSNKRKPVRFGECTRYGECTTVGCCIDENSISFKFEINAKIPVPKNRDNCDNNNNDCNRNEFLNFQNRTVKKLPVQLPKKDELSDVGIKISLETNLPNNITENENYEQSNIKLNANKVGNYADPNLSQSNLNYSNEDKFSSSKWPLPQMLMKADNVSELSDVNPSDINNNRLTSLVQNKNNRIIKIILMKNDSTNSANQYELPEDIESYPNEFLANLGDIHKSYDRANLKLNRMHHLQAYNSTGSNVFRMKNKNFSQYDSPTDSLETSSYYSVLQRQNEQHKNQNNSSIENLSK